MPHVLGTLVRKDQQVLKAIKVCKVRKVRQVRRALQANRVPLGTRGPRGLGPGPLLLVTLALR